MLSTLGFTAMLAMAQAPSQGAGSGQGSFLTSLVPLAVIFAIFYFLMIRPQQKQQKKHREMLGSIKKGDSVVTRGGIMGTVWGVADSVITIEVAENVKIKFSRDSISGVQTANN